MKPGCLLRLTARLRLLIVGFQNPSVSEGQKRVQCPDASGVGAFQIDVILGHIGEHFAAPSGSGDKHIEAALATLPVEWAEIQVHPAVFRPAIADAEQNHIPFVALHRLQVLNEERLVWVRREEPFCRLVFPSQLI